MSSPYLDLVPLTNNHGQLTFEIISFYFQEVEVVPEKRNWCDAFECQILDVVVDGLKKLNKFKDTVSKDANGVDILCRKR